MAHNKALRRELTRARNKKANKQPTQRPNSTRRNVIYSCLRCSIIIVFMCHRSFPFSCNSNNNMRTFFSCCVLFFLARSLDSARPFRCLCLPFRCTGTSLSVCFALSLLLLVFFFTSPVFPQTDCSYSYAIIILLLQ